MKPIISNINRLKWNFCTRDLNPSFVSKKTLVELQFLFEMLKNNYFNLSKYNDDEKYILYYRASKGKFVDSEDYKEAIKYKEFDDAKWIEEHWDNEYPNKYKWFCLLFCRSTYKEINYYYLYLDNRLILSVSDKEHNPFDEHPSYLIPIISKIITNHIELNAKNKFQRVFNETFGYEKRRGIIEYKQMWKIYPAIKRKYLNLLKGVDLNKIFKEADDEEITHFQKLSAGKYYDICKIGYLGVYKEINEDIDSKTLFYQKADGRTHDLEEIDINSEAEFDKWFEINGMHPDHAFEIFPGSSFYRGDLWVDKDEKGYYLQLSGSDYFTSVNVIKFYNSLINSGIKVKLASKELYKSRINGSATFAIENEDNWCYGYTTVFGKSYIDSIHIKDFPKLIPYVKWEEVRMSKYIGGEK